MSELHNGLPIHYRYDDYAYENGLEIKVSKFYPTRETEHCYFVINEWEKHLIKIGGDRLKARQRRVLKNSLRRYCYPTKDEALHSYKKRKEAQIRHCEFSLAKAKQALLKLESEPKDTDCFFAGRPDYWIT